MWNQISSSEQLYIITKINIHSYIIPKDVNIYLHAKFSSCKQISEGKLCKLHPVSGLWLHTKLVNITFGIESTLHFHSKKEAERNKTIYKRTNPTQFML